MSVLQEIAEKVEKGKAADVKLLVQKAIDEKTPAQDILNQALVKGMENIGVKFKANEVFIPEVLIAARAMKSGMELIKPLLAEQKFKAKGKVCVATVKGDLHDIGKNIVCMMFEGAGFEVVDLGIDCSKEKFVEAIKREQPDILGMSALLTTTMVYMKEVVEELNKAGLAKKPRILIGGAPITQAYADEIKADGYAADAASAVDVAKKLLNVA
jgi:5-methyltetrahydrofolate--homocysteine methyltransferase